MFAAAVVIAATLGGAQFSGLGGGSRPAQSNEEKPEPVTTTTRFAPVAWSPTRNELAFVGTVGGAESVIPPGWLLPSGSDTPSGAKDPLRQAIWVVPPNETKADVIATTQGVFSAPTWAPDGESLFYVRWEPALNGEGVLALLRHHRNGSSEVIHREIGRFPFGERRLLSFETSSASPDGLVVVVPWLAPKGLAVFDLETKRIVRRLQQSSTPVWSADSRSLAYFAAETPTRPLQFLEPNGRSIKQLNPAQLTVARRSALSASSTTTPVGKSMGLYDSAQPPRWDHTGHTLFAMRSVVEPPGGYESSRVQLFRIAVADGRPSRVFNAPTVEGRGSTLSSSFAFDSRSDSMFMCAPRPDGRVLVDRFELSGSRSDGAWHPFDDVDSPMPAPMGSIALSADAKRIALRFGKPELAAPVVVWNVVKDRAAPIQTDDAGDLRTAAVLAASARRTLLRVLPDNAMKFQMTFPDAWDSGREHPQRLNAFPRRDNLWAIDDVRLLAVRRLASLGVEFLSQRTPPPSGSVAAKRFDEIALQLHYLREEFEQARRIIDRLGADDSASIERRAMLAILRAQCLEATAGSRMARLSLEPLLEGPALRNLRRTDPETGPHPFILRIEELLSGSTKEEKAGDEDG